MRRACRIRYFSSRHVIEDGINERIRKSKQPKILLPAPLLRNEFSALKNHYNPTKYPIVLCHGFLGFDTLSLIHRPTLFNRVERVAENVSKGLINFEYWHGIKNSLESAGNKVLVARVPPQGSIEERAEVLNNYIDEQCKVLRKDESKKSLYNKDEETASSHSHSSEDNTHEKAASHQKFEETGSAIKLNLICHSMGGLDARYLISKYQQKSYKVASLTTISTPHHGSECADFLVNLLDTYPTLKGMCPKSVFQMTTEYARTFNREIKDDSKVAYYSYGARMNPKWYNVFTPTWKIMKWQILANKTAEGEDTSKISFDNDGLVCVESAKWGEYLGTLDNVDHLDLINWTNTMRSLYRKTVFNEKPTFDPNVLYLDIADRLSKKGF